MKNVCPICKKEEDTVGPKVIGSSKIIDPRFNNIQQSLETVVMCNNCLEDYKKGKFTLNLKEN
jgi:hypothetical protein